MEMHNSITTRKTNDGFYTFLKLDNTIIAEMWLSAMRGGWAIKVHQVLSVVELESLLHAVKESALP